MELWETALNSLCEGCRDMHPEWIEHQANIIKQFIETSHAYIKQLEEDYDDIVHVHVK